jgi:branched-chain amino acid transport system permease protein
MRGLFALLNGREDIGQSQIFWFMAGLVLLGFLLYPTQASGFAASNVSYYFLNVPLAIGLSLLWGYCGVLSFGQVTFFGVAGYVYGVVAGNLVETPYGTLLGSLAGLAAAALLAAVFGFFVFFARVQAWIVPVLTLVLTLLLETFLGQTAGYRWRVGDVLLGGYNGMTGIPALQIGSVVFTGDWFYFLSFGVTLFCYLAARMFVNSPHGKVLLAIREDAIRAELLGYDVRVWQLGVFVVASVLAGVSGLLYVQWGNYITPSALGLLQASLPVIWVAVGGRDSLLAVAISTFFINWFSYTLSSAGNQYALVIMGVLLVTVMLFFPKGIIVTLAQLPIWKKINFNPLRRRPIERSRGV